MKKICLLLACAATLVSCKQELDMENVVYEICVINDFYKGFKIHKTLDCDMITNPVIVRPADHEMGAYCSKCMTIEDMQVHSSCAKNNKNDRNK